MNEAFDLINSRWDDILDFVKKEYSGQISSVTFKTFIAPLVPYDVKQNKNGTYTLFIVVIDNMEKKQILARRCDSMISVAIEDITGLDCNIELVLEADTRGSEEQPHRLITQTKVGVTHATLYDANLNPNYTFDSFVVGGSNNMAHAASLAVSNSPGESFNPLFIYGGPGLGKTHLMQAIARRILEMDPEKKVLYVTSETFTNEVVDFIKNKSSSSAAAEFRKKYRGLDVLLIDDIQFIIGKDRTQEEFFHTFNDLVQKKSQIVITSDKPPKDFENLDERFKSRFENGMTVDIKSPDYETRKAILKAKAERDHFNIDDSILTYIAKNIESNIRELEGALNKVKFLRSLGLTTSRDITLEMAQEALKDMISAEKPLQVTPEHILRVVADHFSISEEDIKSKKRNAEVVYPRQIVMYLSRQMTQATQDTIGRVLGGKDHSTIINGYNKISTLISESEETYKTIEILQKKISPQ